MLRLGAGFVMSAALLLGCGAGGAPPFRPEASEAGYTVLYGLHGMWPHTADGPCAELVVDSAVAFYAQGHNGALECPDHGGLDGQLTELGRGRVAVWGIMFDGITTVTVESVMAATSGSTYLAVLSQPAGAYTVVGRDSSGRPVTALASAELSRTLAPPLTTPRPPAMASAVPVVTHGAG